MARELVMEMLRIRAGLVATAAALLLLLSPGTSAWGQDPLAGLDETIQEMMQDWSVPGVGIAIVQGDDVTYARGFGVKRIGGSDPVDENTIFAIGSSSKAFTAAAIAMLVDEEKLSWDDRVVDRLPTFQLSDPYITRNIRIRDLMSHNTGLLRGDRIWYASGLTRAAILDRVRHQPVTFPLRSTFQYNNTTWIAAGEVIKAVSGMTWDDFVAARIFRPLGMARSTTLIGPLARLDNVAEPHIETPDGELTAVPYRDIDNAGPAGSINSSVMQVAQWVRMQLAGGEYEGERLISEAAVAEMHTAQMFLRAEGLWSAVFPESDFLLYGLGWFLTDYRDIKMVSHGGNIDGMTALVVMVPERDYGWVILTNLNGANGFTSALAHHLVDRLEGGEQLPWNEMMKETFAELEEQARAQARQVEESRLEGTSPTLPLAEYVGTYESDMYGEFVVTEERGVLRATFGAGFEGTLEHWHYDTFRSTWTDPVNQHEFLRFEIGTDGKVAVLHAEIEGSVAFTRR
ncbi:MAG: serine hydrolase [Gemmatimonadetes bacterium]|nr:serine hydrolase [Gemmatimonadota bacterium]MCY3677105.1 serine hydrolase [Gemmatimonadota bacterium]MYA42102.1 serine hydrolase [Gemmatimonadota bacterium]MYE91865.1 serine hydrolase [Gemmatimonadota bacterium]MYJ09592.1 serine hydrolase [Gemmatimonadota bacterium]